MSRDTDSRTNTKATVTFRYVLYSYVGTVSSHETSLHDGIHPPEMEMSPPKTARGCPCGGGGGGGGGGGKEEDKYRSQTQSSHAMELICRCTVVDTECPPECLQQNTTLLPSVSTTALQCFGVPSALITHSHQS